MLSVEDRSSLADILSNAIQSCGDAVGTIREMADSAGELNLNSRCSSRAPIFRMDNFLAAGANGSEMNARLLEHGAARL